MPATVEKLFASYLFGQVDQCKKPTCCGPKSLFNARRDLEGQTTVLNIVHLKMPSMDEQDSSVAVLDICPFDPLAKFGMEELHMDKQRIKQLESRSLFIAMWGNLLMGAAGLLAAVLSNSTAIMMDGLFSLVGFTAAFLARKISRRVDAGPDRLRPMGYAADEALFSTFRALSLLGLVMFAMALAGVNIYKYLRGEMTPDLNFGPLFIYFVVIGGTSFFFGRCIDPHGRAPER